MGHYLHLQTLIKHDLSPYGGQEGAVVVVDDDDGDDEVRTQCARQTAFYLLVT